MSILVEKIRAALDESGRMARAAADFGEAWTYHNDSGIYPSNESQHPGPIIAGSFDYLPEQYGNHIARHDPARVLRQVAAMRKILDLHGQDGAHECPGNDYAWGKVTDYAVTCLTLAALAEAIGIEVDHA